MGKLGPPKCLSLNSHHVRSRISTDDVDKQITLAREMRGLEADKQTTAREQRALEADKQATARAQLELEEGKQKTLVATQVSLSRSSVRVMHWCVPGIFPWLQAATTWFRWNPFMMPMSAGWAILIGVVSWAFTSLVGLHPWASTSSVVITDFAGKARDFLLGQLGTWIAATQTLTASSSSTATPSTQPTLAYAPM